MDYLKLLRERFGFSEFRPGQAETLAALENHKAALAVFPTGAGKSICYQLPALAYEGVTLVVSPLIALMKDQIDFLQRRGVAAARLDSSLSAEEARTVQDSARNGTLKLLYVAPERFNNERFLDLLKHMRISLFAVDEAHCISEWGHNFRPDYLKLAETARSVGAERVLALTATATPSVVQDICKAFQIPDTGSIVTGFYRPNLNLVTTPVTERTRDQKLVDTLKSRPLGPTIVYVTLQRTAERVAGLLQANGFQAEAYHAGMNSDERTAVQDRWTKSSQGIVVATIAFGMGIDKADVRSVIHFNLPKSLESYSQEIGRAGRDGKESIVEMLACASDVPTLENFAYGDTPTEESLHALVRELLGSGAELTLNLYDLSSKHDVRQLVLRTALTYLELEGVLRQGTPFYAGYTVRPHAPVSAMAAHYSGEPARFVAAIFEAARKGTTLYHFDPDLVAERVGSERRRVIRALEVLEQSGLVNLEPSDVRHRFTCLKPGASAKELAQDLAQRFLRREQQEIARLQQVVDLVSAASCQTNSLVGYFGEMRAKPCGHCTFCETGKARLLKPVQQSGALPDSESAKVLRVLCLAHPEALGTPRQMARFLCGLTSPATSKARLGKNALFGRCETSRFADVLAYTEAMR